MAHLHLTGAPMSAFSELAKKSGWPLELEVGLIGSCTNSSYEDMTRAASIAKQAVDKQLNAKAEFTITPGSEMIRKTVERDGILKTFDDMGGTVLANACGPCIGQWARHSNDPNRKTQSLHRLIAILLSETMGIHAHSFVASPEIVTAVALAGRLDFNPLTDPLVNASGNEVCWIRHWEMSCQSKGLILMKMATLRLLKMVMPLMCC